MYRTVLFLLLSLRFPPNRRLVHLTVPTSPEVQRVRGVPVVRALLRVPTTEPEPLQEVPRV